MAAGYIHEPGTRYGPCMDPCKHRDCAASREDAATVCPYCEKPIGYHTHYYRESDHGGRLVHAACLEVVIERERDQAPVADARELRETAREHSSAADRAHWRREQEGGD